MPVHVLADLRRLPFNVRPRVLAALARLDKWPDVSGTKPLSNNWAGHYSMRIGDWRIIFLTQGSNVTVVRIAHRREVYDE